ncbi:MAG: hypothetical protein KIT56_10810 [Gammaproteobacteria bacterium]|nr:hypothetical protein [Gammaproteobacteria bacterium]MCW5584335.1 hypothetical protein [Gammaproteobacteria bacterium]
MTMARSEFILIYILINKIKSSYNMVQGEILILRQATICHVFCVNTYKQNKEITIFTSYLASSL